MEISYLQSLIGWSGIITFLITMAEIPLWFIYPGVPPLKNVIQRTLISLFILPAMIVFSIGVALFTLSPFAICGAAFVIVFSAIHYVSHSMQLGSVLKSNKPIDPTLIGSGGEGSLLIYGPISHLLYALSIIFLSLGLLESDAIPAWIAVSGYVIAAFQVALIPTIFSKTIPAKFYSLNGWNIPVSGGLFTAWVLMVGIYFLVK